MTAGLPRYRASGRTSPRFVPLALTAAALAAGAGWAYQALTGAGWLGLNVLPFLGFVVVVAAVIVAAGRLGHNRNRTVGAVAALVIAGAGLVAAYYFDYRAAADAVAPAPLSFGDWIDARVASGWTFMAREAGEPGTLTGAWVWLAWTVEALVLAIVSLIAGVAFPPFCERCRRWMSVQPLFTRGGLDDAAVESVARAATIDAVFALPPAGPPRGGWELAYSAHRCPDGHGVGYVTVVARRVVETPRAPRVEKRNVQVQVEVPGDRLRSSPTSSVTPG